MRSTWLSALVGGVLLLSLSACSDSTDVGLGVGPTLGGGQPRTLDVIPSLDTTQQVPLTGRVVASLRPGGGPAWRFLVGRVDDPIPGTGVLAAEGYFDVSLPPTLPDTIRGEGKPDSLNVQLRLPRTYLHGDTSNAEISINVVNLTEDPKVSQARADTTLGIEGSRVFDKAVDVPLADTMIINFPSSWLTQERLDDLRKADAESDSLDQVHGFKLVSPNSETAVVGFSTNSAELRLTHKSIQDDTLSASYTSSKSFTHIEQVEPPVDPLPSSHRLLQDGIGRGLEMSWNFDAPPLDTLGNDNDPVNAAQIFVPVDSVKMDTYTPQSFARPLPRGYRILTSRPSEADRPLRLVPQAAPGAARVANNVTFSLLQESFRRVKNGQPPLLDTLRMYVADRQGIPGSRDATLSPGLPSTLPVLVRTDSLSPGPPRLTLTVTPL